MAKNFWLKDLIMIKKIIFTVFFIVLFVSCASSGKSENLVYGVVYDSSGSEALSGVRIYDDNGFVASTDFMGRFSFPNSTKATEFTLKKSGYEEKVVDAGEFPVFNFVQAYLVSYADLCFQCLEFLSRNDIDNASKVLSRIEKVDCESYEYSFLMSVKNFYEKNYDSSYYWLRRALEKNSIPNQKLNEYEKLILSKLDE